MTGAWMSLPVLERLAGSLLHFVWQGAAIAVLGALVLRLMRRRSAEARYLVAASALLTMLIAPVVTFVFYAETGQVALRLLGEVDRAASRAATEATPAGVAVWTGRIVLVWALGVALCLTRLLGGWLLSRRLVRSAAAVTTPIVLAAMQRAQAGLDFHGTVRLLAGLHIDTPVVVGWLRPAILLPASALTGLDAGQFLAVLAHELAHIRRHDFLVNAVQRAVECVLFYHPAVWWVSGRMRVERERCCDDLAVRVCGDRLLYAQALISLERARSMELVLAVPAAGDGVADRVRRILGAKAASRDWPSAMAPIVCVAILAAAGLWRPVSARPAFQEAAQSSTAPVRPAAPQAQTPVTPPDAPLSAIAAIATAQGAKPAAPSEPRAVASPPASSVTQPAISAARQAAREKLGQLRVEYSADSFAKQAAEGDTIAVKLFLAAGMNIDARDQEGFTALARATQKRQTETAQSLVAAGADPNLQTATTGPLHLAAQNGDLATMKVLLLGGAKVDLPVSLGAMNSTSTALIVAAQAGKRDAVALLLDNKADIEASNVTVGTALRISACNGRGDVLRLLVERGADINAMSQEGTALQCAARMHDLEAVRYLVEKGANVDASAQGKYPPLMAALARRGEDKSLIGTIARYLIDRGADVNAKARAGETTPLILAVQNQLADVVLALLARGADPNAKSSAGDTPLTSAIPRPDASIAVSLIDRGADVNLAGPSGGLGQGVPLGLAVQAKNAGLVRALLAKGADPNAPKNPSPLTLATGNAEIVKLLTDAGAKP